MKTLRLVGWVLLAALLAAPFSGIGAYPLHLAIMALLWGYIYTSWSIMGRLGTRNRVATVVRLRALGLQPRLYTK